MPSGVWPRRDCDCKEVLAALGTGRSSTSQSILRVNLPKEDSLGVEASVDASGNGSVEMARARTGRTVGMVIVVELECSTLGICTFMGVGCF